MTLRRGWCPGALAPMETGDGLLVRVRPRAGRYTLAQLQAIARAARHGNGEIDLTNRANLQLRGLSNETLPHALEILGEAGLLDATAAIERLRNVIVSPLAEVAAFDLAHRLECALAEAPGLASLPGKFGFAVETVAAALPPRARADIRLTIDGERVRVRPAWAPSAVAEIPEAVAVALALAAASIAPRSCATAWGIHAPAPRTETPPVGLMDSPSAFGIGLPYGRVTGDALAGLAEAASRLGLEQVHPAVQRCLVFPLHGKPHAPLAQAAHAAGLITGPADPRLVMDVCPGSPACARATTSTRADADALASHLAHLADRPASIHISGCAKGCARSFPAGLTLVARHGAYDVIWNGTAADPPGHTGLSPADLAACATTLTREPCV